MLSRRALTVPTPNSLTSGTQVPPSRARTRRGWRFYPKSFPMLILAGFSLAVLPLIFALINNAISIHELANKSQRAVYNAVQATQNSRLLTEQLTNMERTATHFSIVAEPELFSAFEASHKDFVDTVRRMQSLTLPREQMTALNELARAEGIIYSNAVALRHDPKRLASVVDTYQVLGSLARSLDNTGAAIVSREVASMQALSGDVHDFIYWQLVALVPVALFLVVGATILILKPIGQIEAALRRMGEGDFSKPVAVSGPKDLEALGRQLDWMRLRLIELEEQKTRFMHQLSHELKTPLSAIREGAELLGDGSVGELSRDQLEVSKILHQNALRLQRLIEDLLNYHTVQFQKSGLKIGRVDLASVLRRVVEAHRLPVRAKDIRITVDCPPIHFDADDNKLEVVLDNLLSNAVKFSPPMSEVIVSARQHADEVRIDVIDDGPGVSPQERDKVFDAFYQGSAQPRGTIKGTGLGLAIVREYVAAHRGRVEILEERPSGAHFRIRLPIKQASPA
ncbi:MAG: histidine kinase [Proteobacteria bacterium]|nr:MAG: histidine kinase [Pseudomonadota bacterium]